MTLSTQDRHWHQQYEEMNDKEKEVVREAFDLAVAKLRSENLTCSMDDRAVQLFGAIARLVIESKDQS